MKKKNIFSIALIILGSAVFYTIKSYNNLIAVGFIGIIVLILSVYFGYFGRPICIHCKKRMSYHKLTQKGAPENIRFICKNCGKEKIVGKNEIYKKANNQQKKKYLNNQ